MKRLLLTLAAAASAAVVAAGSAAVADPGHGRGNGHGGGGWDRGRGGDERRGGDRGGWERGRGGDERRGDPRWSGGPPPPVYAPYAPYQPGPRGGYGVRRGGYMPPEYRGAPLQDYGRYRLRAPPRGYTWMRVGGSYVLMSMSTGQIFDVVPY